MNETWRAVIGYEGLYEVSDLGRVRSLPTNDRWRRNGRILNQATHPNGYKQVGLSNAFRRKRTWTVHHLVLTAFIGPRPVGLESRHLDGNPGNNTPGNLAWGTRSE